jgi:hypothetical protein
MSISMGLSHLPWMGDMNRYCCACKERERNCSIAFICSFKCNIVVSHSIEPAHLLANLLRLPLDFFFIMLSLCRLRAQVRSSLGGWRKGKIQTKETVKHMMHNIEKFEQNNLVFLVSPPMQCTYGKATMIAKTV